MQVEQGPQDKDNEPRIYNSMFGCLTGLGVLSVGIALAIVIARDPELVFNYGSSDTPEPTPTEVPIGSFNNHSFADEQIVIRKPSDSPLRLIPVQNPIRELAEAA